MNAPKKSLTRAERRDIYERLEGEKETDFQANRKLRWLETFSKAMQLELIAQRMPEFAKAYSWYFSEISVNAREGKIKHDGVEVSENADRHSLEHLRTNIDACFSYLEAFEDEARKERERQEREAALRKSAIEKLTPEERAALGL